MTKSEIAVAFSARGGRVQKAIFEGGAHSRKSTNSRKFYRRYCSKVTRRAGRMLARQELAEM